MGGNNVTLYAKWQEIIYHVTYEGNGSTGGSTPTDGTNYSNGDTATVLGNTGSLIRTGYTFDGWNTAANGSGTDYTGGDTFDITTSDVTLYGKWTPVDYTVTYHGNTNTGGSVPTDGNTYNITDTVTVLGNTGTLVKNKYNFSGWNTLPNGNGRTYNKGDILQIEDNNIILYAKWEEKEEKPKDDSSQQEKPEKPATVIVNGEEQPLGTETKTTEDGEDTLNVEF